MTSELHVIFGTGPIGKATARCLVSGGKQVRMINRSGKASHLPEGVEVLSGDIYDQQFVAQQARYAASVYQCAQPAYYEWTSKFPAMQAAVIAGVAQSNARLVVMENLYGYGRSTQPMTETTSFAAHTRKGKLRAQMSEHLFAAHQAGRIRATSVRASNFYGPEYQLMGDQVVKPALQGKKATLLGNADMPHSFSYVNDIGATMALLGSDDRGLGRPWHAPSPAALTQREFVAILAKILGKPVGYRTINTAMVWLLGRFVKEIAETVEMMYEWQAPFVMDSSAFSQTFGLEATPIEEGIRSMVDWFRN